MSKIIYLFLFLVCFSPPLLAQSAASPNVSARLSPARTRLSLSFKNLRSVKSLTYEVKYTSNSREQGIFGQVGKVKSQLLLRQLFLGTCSRKVCTPHSQVKDLSVTVKYKLVSGKSVTRILTLP